jgi:uncharacterized protein (TIGR03086 family)
MSHYTDRFVKIAAAFSARVDAVAANAWDNPAPCEGWRARDVVRHLAEWVPGFFASFAGLSFPTGPSADDDPVGAWNTLRTALVGHLSDRPTAEREIDTPMGRLTIEAAVDMIVTNDVFLHTWDLARATGLDETLDPVEVEQMFVGMEPMDEMLRNSGQYGARFPVADNADTQSKLIAFIGRDPYHPA